MLSFVIDGIRDIYSWSMSKLRSTALDFIALFNKEYADSKRIEYITLKNIKIDLGLQVPNLEMEKLKEFDFKLNDLLLTKSDINLHNIELLQKRDPLYILLDNPHNRDLFSRINNLGLEKTDLLKGIIKPNFSEIISKLSKDEYARYIDNLGFIFPLMLRYRNFVHSDWVSNEYSNSALIELIKTCDSRKIMEKKIDLWQGEEKLIIDISLDAGSLAYINGMFPLIQKAIKNKEFLIKECYGYYSNFPNGFYENGIELLVNKLKDSESLEVVVKIINDLTQNYTQYIERCIGEKTGIKTITYDLHGVLDPVSSLLNISINALEKHNLLK